MKNHLNFNLIIIIIMTILFKIENNPYSRLTLKYTISTTIVVLLSQCQTDNRDIFW